MLSFAPQDACVDDRDECPPEQPHVGAPRRQKPRHESNDLVVKRREERSVRVDVQHCARLARPELQALKLGGQRAASERVAGRRQARAPTTHTVAEEVVRVLDLQQAVRGGGGGGAGWAGGGGT